jgi:hypothetical protein
MVPNKGMGSEWGTINMVLNKGHNLPLICNEDILIKEGNRYLIA